MIQQARTDVIYACGPMPMLRQVTVLARRWDLPVLAAVEEAMACGIGVCMTCVLPVVGSDGITRMVRACTDGPVFRGEQIRWDDIGTIPFDAFGAPGWEPRPGGGAGGPGRRRRFRRAGAAGRRFWRPGGRRRGRKAAPWPLTCAPGWATRSCPTRS